MLLFLRHFASSALIALTPLSLSIAGPSEVQTESRIPLSPASITNESELGDPTGLLDEQDQIIGAPVGSPETAWKISSQYWKTEDAFSAYIDLGAPRQLSKMYLYDTNGTGKVVIETGAPGEWELLTEAETDNYKDWKEIQIDRESRYVRITVKDGDANFSEVAIYQYLPEAYAAMVERKAEEERLAAEREEALAKAADETRKRPLVDAGPPFGELYLIEEIDVATQPPLVQSPEDVSKVETILGKKARVLSKTADESAFFAYRIGKMKLLEPGMTYVLQVEYPEDRPRTVIVMNGGNESSRGFHTGSTIGDALHAKYVSSLPESLEVPLSGGWENWSQLFNLNDRTPELGFIRNDEPKRVLTAEDGFTVTISQWSARNMPESAGAAVSKIRLLGVPDAAKLDAKYTLPEGLPHRHLFWREEMADMVVNLKDEELQATKDPLDWWRFKRNTMKFLGMNTYTKDLLEFGAVQHWDTTEGGGNKWAFFDSKANFWPGIVQTMGEAGFDILPYYEYAGSKGQAGLGNKRMAKPLTRDDAFTHIKWIESANVDLTSPEAYEDFKKMLDLTIVRFKDQANFVGAWLRPRGQMPMSFADETRKRFADEDNSGKAVTRQQLIDDKALLARYEKWWFGKRREFLATMRDYLREKGIDDAAILFTAESAEPGVRWPDWQNLLVTDQVAKWKTIVAEPDQKMDDGSTMGVISVDDVVTGHLYLNALELPVSTWGGWENNYGNPSYDPSTYVDDEGVMLGIPFNRLYTVADPAVFDAFRNKEGLAIIRHFALNENMMFGPDGKTKLGYFVADIERAGPYCMMAEAVAVANGDPTFIGYLSAGNYARGFPQYVRKFNSAFLSLPALPSERVEGAASDPDVIVRKIETAGGGTYLAVVNTGMTDKPNVQIALPSGNKLTDASNGDAVPVQNGKATLSFYPFELRALKIPPEG